MEEKKSETNGVAESRPNLAMQYYEARAQKSRIEHWRKFLSRAQSPELAAIHKLMAEQPRECAMLLIEAALGVHKENNPFAVTSEGKPLAEYSHAKIKQPLLTLLHKNLLGEPVVDEKDAFVSLKDHISRFIHFRTPEFYWPHYTDPGAERVLEQFCEYFDEELEWSYRATCELVKQGMPIYERDAAGQHRALPFSREEYVYLRLRDDMEVCRRLETIPYWTNNFYFNHQHLKTHNIFFSGDGGKEEETEIRRNAFLHHIGFNDQANNGSTREGRAHRTKLLNLVDVVIARYYGPNFDPTNRDTWPTQTVVVTWLKKEYALSGREAEAIDIIARPDTIRGK